MTKLSVKLAQTIWFLKDLLHARFTKFNVRINSRICANINALNVETMILSTQRNDFSRAVIDLIFQKFLVNRFRRRLLEYSIMKHQKFEFSTLYTQFHVQNQKEVSKRLLVYFVYFFFTTFTSISESTSFKCSIFSIATHRITSKSMKKLSINCSFTFSASSFRTFVSKHQKFYLIIDDLIRIASITNNRLFSVCNQSKDID